MNRIQRRRTPGWRKPENAICINRGTKYGNPMKIVRLNKNDPFGVIEIQDFVNRKLWHRAGFSGDVPDMLHVFRHMLKGTVFMDKHFQVWSDYFSKLDLTPLLGHDLACYCPIEKPCHGDVYIELCNELKK